MNDSGLSYLLFRRLNKSGNGELTFLEFMEGMCIMMKVG